VSAIPPLPQFSLSISYRHNSVKYKYKTIATWVFCCYNRTPLTKGE